MKIIFVTLLFIFLMTETYSQVKIIPNGNVGIGCTPTTYKLQVSGPSSFTNGTYPSLIIDNGSDYYKQVYPSVNNTCRLGLSNKAFKTIYTYSLQDLNSDSTQKEHIKDLHNALNIILNLRGVRFDLKKSVAYNDTSVNYSKMGAKLEKERKNKIGFIGQEMIHVLPEAVQVDDSTGIYSIDYTRVIPVLVEAMKEQQTTIEKLNTEIESLKSGIKYKSAEVTTGTDDITAQPDKPYLEQNVPNPFSAGTTINFYIPANNQNASVYIYDMQGLQKKAYSIAAKGKSDITINGTELQAGMYLYTLIVDGKEVDTKRMILTN